MARKKSNNPSDQRVLDDIKKYGWHTLGVMPDNKNPGFAYSVGMHRTFRHPEIIIVGMQDPLVMIKFINHIGELIRDGHRFADWNENDKVLANYLCIFRSVRKEVFKKYLCFGLWFYGGQSFPALQCVWPDKLHRYPWHRDNPEWIQKQQPLLARPSRWPFHDGKNRAAFTTSKALEGSQPIRQVFHESDGDWQFLCGTTNKSTDARIISLAGALKLDPGIAKIADLPEGWMATRTDTKEHWKRTKIDVNPG